AGADRIAAHFLEYFDLSLQRPCVDRGAQRAEVVVIAHAIERNVFAIEEKAFVFVEFDRANAKGALISVSYFAILRESSHRDIKIRLLQTPQLWILQCDARRNHIPCSDL